jgi:hypothetical protein
VLDFEADSIRLAITAKRHRRKPIDPEASQFEDSIGVFSPDGTLNRWVYTPSDLSVALTHLDRAPSPDLFGIDPFNEPNAKQRVVTALDTINARYGLNTVYLGSIHQVRKEAPTRIPFGPPPPLEEFDDTSDKLRTPRGPRGIRASETFPECSKKRQRLVESAPGVSPRAAHRTGREPLDSSGSCHQFEGHRLPSKYEGSSCCQLARFGRW